MLLFYPVFASLLKDMDQRQIEDENYVLNMFTPVIDGNQMLYNKASGSTDESELLLEYGDSEFHLLKKYLDYDVYDKDGKSLLGTEEEIQKKLKKKANTEYAVRIEFHYDAQRQLSGVEISGKELDKSMQYHIENGLLQEAYENREYGEETSLEIHTDSMQETVIVYGMTKENMRAYVKEEGIQDYQSIYYLTDQQAYIWAILFFAAVSAAAALWLPVQEKQCAEGRKWNERFQKLLKCPPEAVCIVICILIALPVALAEMVWRTVNGEFIRILPGNGNPVNQILALSVNLVFWFLYFAAVYWMGRCIREGLKLKKTYIKERSVCVKVWRRLHKEKGDDGVRISPESMLSVCKNFLKSQYDALLHLDLQNKANRAIIRIVLINFVVIFLLSMFWIYGIWASILYSVILALFLRKYFNKIQEQYRVLLKTTNRLAEGDLDTPITGDAGMFAPIQSELMRIQKGFKKAVDEEVKSERMKTDLITNVSHDLKTPLTAIITYIDLVKNEENEEKRKEYIGVLERKSLRLKVLIEDLFEISKATSRNVTLHYMKIDIVDLLKQVGLEYDSSIRNAGLEMKWDLPEHKIVLYLDSQKTYRIFENMIVNITKYAMPHTRVYISMKETEHFVKISMKNVSASELNFNTDEITDRFVRGDISRNTEGSGLGLAIVKSFVELQHGTLKISTEADLFKAEIIFPKRQEMPEEGEAEPEGTAK